MKSTKNAPQSSQAGLLYWSVVCHHQLPLQSQQCRQRRREEICSVAYQRVSSEAMVKGEFFDTFLIHLTMKGNLLVFFRGLIHSQLMLSAVSRTWNGHYCRHVILCSYELISISILLEYFCMMPLMCLHSLLHIDLSQACFFNRFLPTLVNGFPEKLGLIQMSLNQQ